MSAVFHLVQRSRSACLLHPHDCVAYLDALVTFSGHCECALHGYVLMRNHVHVLATAPGVRSARELMVHLADSFGASPDTQICPVHARRYLLECMRYIELNPVRAHMVERPEDYRWSSYRANALGWRDPAVTPHALYYALGRSPAERRRAYARFVDRNHSGAAVSP